MGASSLTGPVCPVHPNRRGTGGHPRVAAEPMRSVLALLMVAVILLPEPAHAQPAAAAPVPGIRVQNGRLVEANGSDLVLRGVNHDFIWYPDKNGVFAAIKAAGANAVRVPLGTGHQFRRTK